MAAGRVERYAMLMILAAAWCWALPAQSPSLPKHGHVLLRVQSGIGASLHGRLLVFVKQGAGDKVVDTEEFHPEATWVAAKEISNLENGASVEVDGEDIAYPKPFSAMPPGEYEAQAVVDTDHNYNYAGRDHDDWVSPVVALQHWPDADGVEPLLVLNAHAPEDANRMAMMSRAEAGATPDVARYESFVSPLLSAFWGRPVEIKAWVILPPGYAAHAGEHYPTAYWTHGFGGQIHSALLNGEMLHRRMAEGKMPPMFWVMLDESCAQGTHEFADSANNGPWGAALTTEFIPYLEAKYRMDAKASGRLLNGHSSGGWATLQLEVNYPQIFGGTWSTSPDPSDFHDFSGTDLYAPHANVYRGRDGAPAPIMREDGKVTATFEQFAMLEAVLGEYGGQVSSFDWVFSPRSDSGGPVPMFDRKTGAVDTEVVAYWREHYDLARIVESKWPEKKDLWRGRFHLFVGTADTFYLDGAAHKFEAVLSRLGAEPHFTYLAGRTHFDVYKMGDDRYALFDRIGKEMYAVARPGASSSGSGAAGNAGK